jgi:hypothetical protein
VDILTLNRWWQAGQATPALVTTGGHAWWDLDALRVGLTELRSRDDRTES